MPRISKERLAKALEQEKTISPVDHEKADEADIQRGVKEILAHFGRIDVTVNNAGYILVGALKN